MKGHERGRKMKVVVVVVMMVVMVMVFELTYIWKGKEVRGQHK